MSMLPTTVQVVLFLLAAVAAHEGAHVLAARRYGLAPQEVRLGLGPNLVSLRLRGVTVRLGLIPLAVAVRFEDARGLSPAARAGIAAAGPMATVGVGLGPFWLAFLNHQPWPWGFLALAIWLAAWLEFMPLYPLDGYRIVAACREASSR